MSNIKGAPRLTWAVSMYRLSLETEIAPTTLRRIMLGVHSPRLNLAKKIVYTINDLYGTDLTVEEVFETTGIPIEICSERYNLLTI
jgi:hypothetical protein